MIIWLIILSVIILIAVITIIWLISEVRYANHRISEYTQKISDAIKFEAKYSDGERGKLEDTILRITQRHEEEIWKDICENRRLIYALERFLNIEYVDPKHVEGKYEKKK